MDEPNSPYVYRDELSDSVDTEGTPRAETDVVIVGGRAMSYRWYRR